MKTKFTAEHYNKESHTKPCSGFFLLTLIRNPLGKPLLDGDPSQCLKNKLNQAESDFYFFAAPYAFAMMTSLHQPQIFIFSFCSSQQTFWQFYCMNPQQSGQLRDQLNGSVIDMARLSNFLQQKVNFWCLMILHAFWQRKNQLIYGGNFKINTPCYKLCRFDCRNGR